jgi:hypothetical protein
MIFFIFVDNLDILDFILFFSDFLGECTRIFLSEQPLGFSE